MRHFSRCPGCGAVNDACAASCYLCGASPLIVACHLCGAELGNPFDRSCRICGADYVGARIGNHDGHNGRPHEPGPDPFNRTSKLN